MTNSIKARPPGKSGTTRWYKGMAWNPKKLPSSDILVRETWAMNVPFKPLLNGLCSAGLRPVCNVAAPAPRTWNRGITYPHFIGAWRLPDETVLRLAGDCRPPLHEYPASSGNSRNAFGEFWWSDTLIVCGTQIVSDNLTGPKGWPYELFKWSALAALCRVKLLFIGIGVGPIDHPLSRWLIKRSLGLADYRSYRDKESKQCMEGIGFRTDRDSVCPDLAFGLSCRLLHSDAERTSQRPIVGVGLGYIAGLGVREKLAPGLHRDHGRFCLLAG